MYLCSWMQKSTVTSVCTWLYISSHQEIRNISWYERLTIWQANTVPQNKKHYKLSKWHSTLTLQIQYKWDWKWFWNLFMEVVSLKIHIKFTQAPSWSLIYNTHFLSTGAWSGFSFGYILSLHSCSLHPSLSHCISSLLCSATVLSQAEILPFYFYICKCKNDFLKVKEKELGWNWLYYPLELFFPPCLILMWCLCSVFSLS